MSNITETGDLFGHSGAVFSPCCRWRYRLWRRWGDGPMINFLMLNPSTADAFANDPTVARCQRRARDWGYGGLHVTNLFAWRATDPAALREAADPVGADNDAYILEVAEESACIVCAWGVHGRYQQRGACVTRSLEQAGIQLYCLQLTASGEPGHPLYLGDQPGPVPYSAAATSE